MNRVVQTLEQQYYLSKVLGCDYIIFYKTYNLLKLQIVYHVENV